MQGYRGAARLVRVSEGSRSIHGIETQGLSASGGAHTMRVHPHGLRHTHAAELAAENVPINVIQAQLGHSNAATTSRYIQHIAPQQLINTIRKREWRPD